MISQTSIQKLKRGAMVVVTGSAVLFSLAFTPTATRAEEKETKKVKIRIRCCRPIEVDIDIETTKETKTEGNTGNMAVAPNDSSIEGSGTATIVGGQLRLALTNLTVKRSDTVSLDRETGLNRETARALGYERVILLPGQYHLGPEQVLSISVRTEGPLTEDTSVGKFEVSGQFASLNVGHSSRTVRGLGTRLTYNVVPNIALEAELNHFPEEDQGTNRLGSGRITQGLFGLKAGKRFERFGVFGKVRPGLVSFGQTILGSRIENGRLITISGRTTHSALDLGGVLEFYPSRRLVTRFDIGDTIIRYPCPTPTFPSGAAGDLFSNPCPFGPLTRISPPPRQYLTEHNFQFNSSVGFRFF